MKSKLLKRGLVILLGIIPIYILLPIGDYRSGMASALSSLFFEAIFVLTSLIVIITYAIKKKIAVTALITLFILTSFYIFLLNLEDDKFWTTKKLEAFTYKGLIRANLRLYDNKTFTASVWGVENGYSFQGNFNISNDTLYLMREDLPKLTHDYITNTYILKDTILISPDKKFVDLVIENHQ